MLESLCLMPPQLGQMRRGAQPGTIEFQASRRDANAVKLPLPLFWDRVAWHTWSPMVAQQIFSAVTSRGILVSALQSELGLYGDDAKVAFDSSDEHASLPRMLPYRNERYGLSNADFDQASVIDVHLSPPRDDSGRFAYSAALLGRWEGTPDDQPLSGGGWIPAMTLPPDVSDAASLAVKVAQLRSLAPEAAVIASVTPEWLEESLPILLGAKADALYLRLGQIRMNGIELACFVQRIGRRVATDAEIPIWLTPSRSLKGESLGVADSVKLMALGISAIAIDGWMDEAIEEFDEIETPSSFASNPENQVLSEVDEILGRLFDPQLELFTGLYSSLFHAPAAERLGTFDPHVAELLDIPRLGRL